MTLEQIKIFNDFLSERTLYYTFYECLSKAPIEQAYAKKDVYLMRVTPLLVLNYGFWQDRGVNRIKEADWRHHREAWIERAQEADILGDGFRGIEPKNIISAINAELNGKQFMGSLSDVDKYTQRIAIRAVAIQDKRDFQLSPEVNAEIDELRKIIDDHSVRTPAEIYTSAMFEQRVKINISKVFAEQNYSGKKNYVNKQFATLTSAIATNSSASIIAQIEAVQDLCEKMLTAIEQCKQMARADFNNGLAEYERYYLEWQDRQAKAKARYDEIMREVAQAKSTPPPAEATDQKPQSAVKSDPASAPTTSAAVTNPDEKIIVLRPTPQSARRISLSPSQFSCTFDDSPQGWHYRITINSTIAKRIIDNQALYYRLVERQGKMCLRFTTECLPSQRVNVAQKGISCNICDKLLVEYLRRHFGITSRTMIINVAVDKNEPAPNVLCELTSAMAISFQ